jgi:hypothetical protein
MEKTIDRNKVLELYNKGMTDAKIARILGASPNGIGRIRKDIFHLPIVTKSISLTRDMEEVLVGTILGDAWLGYIHDQCRFPKIVITHCKAQEEYCNALAKWLKPIIASVREHSYGNVCVFNGKKYRRDSTIIISGRNVKCLVSWRKAFYKNGVKIIPLEFIKSRFTAKSLAVLYMDEGCKNGTGYNLNMQSYTFEELQKFIDFLFQKFNLEFIIKKDKTLYLRHSSTKLFTSLIRPYITNDMLYKIQQ